MKQPTGKKWEQIATSVIVMLMGAVLILMAMDIITVDESRFNAPRWVAGLAGMVFFAGGAVVGLQDPSMEMYFETKWYKFLHSSLITVILTVFIIVGNWIPFGPGARAFSGALGVGGVSVSGGSSELSGRIFFGIGAVIMDLAFLAIAIKAIRDRWLKPKDEKED